MKLSNEMIYRHLSPWPGQGRPSTLPTQVKLVQDCSVVLIPSGRPATLPKGHQVVITQTLGGSVTIRTDHGYLARIDRRDAETLGLKIDNALGSERNVAQNHFDIEQVIERLRTVYDPEIPVNIVDLGLLYECEAKLLTHGGHRVEIKMSMTAPGCGMGDVLREDARRRAAEVPGVTEVDVTLAWDPPWNWSRMSETARLQLGMW